MNGARYWIGGLVVVGVVGYLAITGARENMVSYLSIPEVRASPVSESRGVRIAGHVSAGSIEPRGSREGWFTVLAEDDSLRARYRGVVPDTFKDGAEVVIEGRMAGDHFSATTLLAKCPSKYEAELPGSVGVASYGTP